MKYTNFSVIEELKGKKVNSIFYQPVAGILSDVDMFVINFGDNFELSLHIFAFFRVKLNDKILLTSSDCCFSSGFEGLSFEEKERARNNYFAGTLLENNIKKVLEVLSDAYVIDAYSNEIGDIIIKFNNSVVFEVYIDALYNDFEAYRLIISKKNETYFEHHIVYVNQMNIFYDLSTEVVGYDEL